MLEFFHRLARKLQPFRRALIFLMLVFFMMAVFGLVISGLYPSVWLQLGLSGALWSALLLATTDLFRSLPPRSSRNKGWFTRIRLLVIRFLYGFLAILVMLSSLALIRASFRLFSM